MTQIAIPPASAPSRPIRRALRRVDVRLRSLASARGLGTAGLVAALGAVPGMAADFLWALPQPARWAIWGLWVAAVGSILAARVLRPLTRRSRWIDLAAVAERVDPRLGERLTGSIALLDGAGHAHGSPALIAALAEDAAGHVGEFDPSLVHAPGRPIGRLMAGMLALGLVAAPGFVRPDPFQTLGLRFLAPWMDLDRVGWFSLTVTPGDKVVAVGSDLAIEAKVAPRYGESSPPESALLEWLDEKGTTHRVRMTPRTSEVSTSRAFDVTLPRLAGSMSYRVSTTAARSRSFRVTAVEPPMICELKALIEPPSYTKLAASQAKDPARIEAVEGSRITLTFASCMRFRKFEVVWPVPAPAKPQAIEIPSEGDMSHGIATLEAVASGPYVLTLRQDYDHGLDGHPETRQLVVRADAPPTLAVKGPAAVSEARPDDLLQVGVAARDDFAVASAELHYEIRRSKATDEIQAGHVDLKLDGLGSPVARGVGSLALRDLALEPGDALAYRVKVVDNRPAPKGPNVTWSDAKAISIVATAEPMLAHDDRVRRESFQARLDEARKANTANRRETEQLRYAADAAQRDGAAWNPGRDTDLAAREAEARAIEDKLQLLARDLQGDPTYGTLARPTRQAAEVEAEAGRDQLDKARKAPNASKRLAELRQADARLGALGNRLDEIRRQFDALAKLDLDRQKLRELAAKEDALAARAARGPLDKAGLAADQDALRKALDALLAQSPGLRAGVLASQADEAAKLAKQARALAEKQRAEARKTSEAPRTDASVRALAQAQKDLEDDARRFSLEVDEPLAENNRARIDTDAVRRPIEPLERGDLPDAVRRLEESENGLRRLARDVEDVPLDPKALARRLARRQEQLANDVIAAVAEPRRKDSLPPDEQAAFAARSRPLAERQADIAKLAAGIVPPEPQKGQAREAVQATERASENLKALKPREAEDRQNHAKRALNQLADALTDPYRKLDESRRKIDEAKRKEEEVLREVDRQINETWPKGDKPNADAKAAADLAEKIAPLVQKQKDVAEVLAKLDVEPRVRPQRDRAAARAARLADQIQAVKDQAPPRQDDAKAKPPATWHVLGPFPTMSPKVPFDPARPVDFGAAIKDADGKTFEWKPAPPQGDEGKVNLGQIYGTKDNQAAFGVAEVVSPTRRKAQLSIGSDDTMVIWLNGRQVFDFGGSRAFTMGQDKVEVELLEGVNRLVIRCGNGNSEWAFGVNASPPPPAGFDAEKSRRLRETLASAKADAQAALYRLEAKAQGAMSLDDLAEDLAAEQKAAAEALAAERSKPPEDDPTAREQAALDRKRIATALRNLPAAAEAPALQAEAVRLADQAAALDADPKAAKLAAEAARALARRLADALPPRELAAALARAERALEAPEARADPAQLADRQKAIAAELTHPPAPPAPKPGEKPPAKAPEPSPASEKAQQAVRQAAALAEQARRPDPSKPAPLAEAVADAQAKAAEALEKMAADPALGPDPAIEAARLAAEAKPNANNPADAAKVAADPNNKPAGDPARPGEPAAVPTDPELGLGPEQAAEAADLALRQRQIRERLQAAMADRVAPQQDLRREAQALGRDLADLRDQAREINARAQGQANAAADLAGEHAPRAMEKGAEQLAQGRLDQARDAQRQAAEFVERAAQAAEDLAAGLRAEGPGEAGNAATRAANGLGEARESLRGAARQLAQPSDGPAAAQAAVPAMHQAADSLRAAAQPSGAGPAAPSMAEADPDNPDPTAAPAGVADADLTALQDLVRKKTGRRWGELPGHLRTEILQLSKGRYRDDYARLIQLYFREIAADAAKAEKP